MGKKELWVGGSKVSRDHTTSSVGGPEEKVPRSARSKRNGKTEKADRQNPVQSEREAKHKTNGRLRIRSIFPKRFVALI